MYSVEELWELIFDNLRNGIQLFIPHKTLKKKLPFRGLTSVLQRKFVVETVHVSVLLD